MLKIVASANVSFTEAWILIHFLHQGFFFHELTICVFQTLFSGTVAENIGYRDLMRGINMMQVEDAAKLANADEFIRTLSQGYETNIGQRGSLLSGGQKQR